jgi:predicted PilT family ATPase
MSGGSMPGGMAGSGVPGGMPAGVQPPPSAGGRKQKLMTKIPNSRVGTVIGKSGATIAQIERMAGVSITIEKTPVPAEGQAGLAGELVRNLHLEAFDPAALAMGERLIHELLADQIDGRLLSQGVVQPVWKGGART